MKFYTTTATILLPLISSLLLPVEAANRHAGTRRQLDLTKLDSRSESPSVLPPVSVGPRLKFVKRTAAMREASPVAIPVAGYGAIPMMNAGTMPIVGLAQQRREILKSFSHNGQQGTETDSTTTTTSSDDDDEDCDAEDDDDEEEDCDEEGDVADTTNVQVNAVDVDDEDCDEEDEEEENDTNSSATSTSSSSSWSAPSSTSSSSSAAAAATSKASAGSSSGGSQASKGIATWYTQNGNAGHCGKVNPDSAKIIALYTSLYGDGSNCGRSVMIQNLDDGTSTTAVVADSCPSCGGPEDIDLSVGAFQAIDPLYQTHGIRNIKWWFTD